MQELAKRVLGKNAIVDDVAKLTSKAKDNPVGKILLETNPNKAGYNKILPSVSAKEKEQLMQIAYRDSSKLLQRQKSYPTNAKLASDIEKGFGQSFSKEASGRLFIAGDRTTVAAKEVLKKTADAPKALPKPTATQIAKVKDVEAGKAATEAAKGRITAGMGVNREILKQVPKESRKQIIKLQRGTEKLQKAAKGTETGEVIAEGLHGPTTLGKQLAEKGWKISKEATTKPPWWQATIPPFLRTGKGVWNPYKGAYPPQVSALRVGGTGAGIGLLAYNFPRAGDILKAQKEKENILSPEDILKTEMDKWAAAFNPEAITEEVDISLPERIE